MNARTEERYLQQVMEITTRLSVYKGIKGKSYLSNWLSLPKSTIIDYMHGSLLGLTKQLLKTWLSVENNKQEYYICKNKLIIKIVYY